LHEKTPKRVDITRLKRCLNISQRVCRPPRPVADKFFSL
jgi:hypothetical protein